LCVSIGETGSARGRVDQLRVRVEKLLPAQLIAPIGQTFDQAAPRREHAGLFHIHVFSRRRQRPQPRSGGLPTAVSITRRLGRRRSLFFSERFSRGARIPLMNTPQLFSNLNKSTSRIASALRRFAGLIFGNISWRPPGWL